MIQFEKEILIKINFNIGYVLIIALTFLIKDKLYHLDISISTINKWKTLITVMKLRQFYDWNCNNNYKYLDSNHNHSCLKI